MDRQPDRARPLSAQLPGRGHRLSGHRILADLSSSAGGLRRGPMRHAFLQPPGKDGLVACNGAGRTRRSLSLSRPPIPRSLNKETMMKQLRSEEQTSELQSLMRISSAVFCLKKKKTKNT